MTFLLEFIPHPCQHLDAIHRPVGHLLDARAHPRNVQQQERHRHKARRPNYLPENLLQRHRHHRMEVVSVHELVHVELLHVHTRERQIRAVTRHIVGHEVLKQRGVESVARGTGEVHVNHIEDEQGHEEVLQLVHRLVQRPHQRHREHRIGAPPKHQRPSISSNRHINIHLEVHPQRIRRDESEADGEEFPYFPFSVSEPEKGNDYTGIYARQRPQAQSRLGVFLQSAHLAPVNLLQRVLRAEQYLRYHSNQEYGNHIFVSKNFQRDVRLLHRLETVEGERQQDEREGDNPAQAGRLEPHQVVAIDKEVADHQHQHAHQQPGGDVDALERHPLRHRAEGLAKGELHEDDEAHRADGEHVHHLPREVEGNHCRKPRAACDGGEQDDVQHGEEDPEVARRRDPQLDVAHTLEGALYLRDARDEADGQENGHIGGAYRDEIADADYRSRAAEQLLVGEAELHPEKHRKPDRHTRQAGVEQHQQVLDHQVGGAAHRFQRAEIDPAGELDAHHLHEVNPRLDTPRHECPEHGHHEGMTRLFHNGLVFYLTLHTVACLEPLQFLGAILVEGDADGEPLLHLDEVAGSVIDGQQRKSAAGGVGQSLHTAFVLVAGNGIHHDVDLRTILDMGQLAFTIVGLHPLLFLVHDTDKGLSGIDQLPDVDVAGTDYSRVGGNNVAVREVEFRQLDCRLRQLHRRFGSGTAVALLVGHILLHINGMADLVVAGLGGKVGGVGLVVLVLRNAANMQ